MSFRLVPLDTVKFLSSIHIGIILGTSSSGLISKNIFPAPVPKRFGKISLCSVLRRASVRQVRVAIVLGIGVVVLRVTHIYPLTSRDNRTGIVLSAVSSGFIFSKHFFSKPVRRDLKKGFALLQVHFRVVRSQLQVD